MISKKMSFGLSPILKTSEPDPKNLLNKIRKNLINPTNQASVESLNVRRQDMNKRNPLDTSIKKSIEETKKSNIKIDKFNKTELQESVENIRNVDPNYTKVGNVRSKIKNPQWYDKDTGYVDNKEVDNARIMSQYYSDPRTQTKLAENIKSHNTNPSYRPLSTSGVNRGVNTSAPMVNREEAGFNEYTQIMANQAILNGLESRVVEPASHDDVARSYLGYSTGKTTGGGSSMVQDVNDRGAAVHEMTHNMAIKSSGRGAKDTTRFGPRNFEPGPFTQPQVNPETGEVENVVASQYRGETLKKPFGPNTPDDTSEYGTLNPDFNESKNSRVRNDTMRADYAGNTSNRFQFDDLQGQLMNRITDEEIKKGNYSTNPGWNPGGNQNFNEYIRYAHQMGQGQNPITKAPKAGKEYYAHLQGFKRDILEQGDEKIIEALMDSKITPEILDKLTKKDGFKSKNLDNFKRSNHTSEHLARFLNEVAYDTSDQFIETNNNVA